MLWSAFQLEYLPIPSHPPGEVVTAPLCFHKDDGLVLFLTHDFLKQTNESKQKKTEGDSTFKIL